MKENKILITGGSGMIGSALREIIPNAQFVSSKEYDLTIEDECIRMFEEKSPEWVIHLAARVGGVKANHSYLADFYSENILINTHVLKCAAKRNVKKMLSMMSTCVYPAQTTYPLREENIHKGEPHWTNFAYAYAKRMLDAHSRACREQYGSNFITAIPNNMYGKNDNFHLEDSHVIPAMIRKMHEAKLRNEPVELWGDGKPIREFTYAKDIAKIILFLMEEYNEPNPINIGNTDSLSIGELANCIKNIVGLEQSIKWNNNQLSGQQKKPSTNDRLIGIGFNKSEYTKIETGLLETYDWFSKKYPNIRGYKK